MNGLLKHHFKQLLTYATKSSYFLFNGVYYSQIDGVAMGSPLGPTLANLFLAYHEENWLNNCPVQFKPTFFRRYVDDIFLLFDSHDHVKKFLKYMNSRHRNINFTYEEEQNNTLAFLDIKITREGGKFVTSVYRKKTFSGVYLNYTSFLPIDYKRGLISTLLFRTYNLCSDYYKLHEEIARLKLIWQKNGFPLFLLTNVWKRFWTNYLLNEKLQKSLQIKKKSFYLWCFWAKFPSKLRRSFKLFSVIVVEEWSWKSSSHLQIDYVAVLCLKIGCHGSWIPCYCINSRAVHAIVPT